MPTLQVNLLLPTDNHGVGEVEGVVEEADLGSGHMSLPAVGER
jgi:hypothetical protein